jgi:hypothetical protein
MDADDTPSRGRKVINATGVSKVWTPIPAAPSGL